MLKHSDRRATRRWAKSGPPLRGCPERPRGSVAKLARATSPRCAPRLATDPLRAITVEQPHVIWLLAARVAPVSGRSHRQEVLQMCADRFRHVIPV